jgi:general secretion pathway protein D
MHKCLPKFSHFLGALLLGSAITWAPPSVAQQQVTITPNYKDADLSQIIQAVSEVTGKNFIIDPRVNAKVTMLSSTPMSPAAFYETFLSVLQVYGYVAVPAGKVIKIIPNTDARQLPANDLPNSVSSTSDEIVTQVIEVKSVSAAQLVPILRPLIPQYGHLAAYPGANMLIISDRASNVNRIVRIIGRLDSGGDDTVDVVPMQNATANELVRIVNQLYQGQAASEGGTPLVRMVADERTNSVLISGEKSQRLKLKALIVNLDTPLEAGGDTRVRYLHYADAEKIADKLKQQATATAQAQTGGAAGAASAASGADRSTTIWADPATNSLIMTAPPKIMKSLMSVVDQLDIRRAQVLVEAIIVDVNATNGANLGVNWVIDAHNHNGPVGGFLPQGGSSPIVNLAGVATGGTSTAAAVASAAAALPAGTSIGVGRLNGNGINFAALINALRTDSKSNIIATPSTVTMDNQEAQLKVATEVPFLTGSFSNTGAQNGSVNPFQTIQRQEVGTILKVTPKINEGSAVMLKIELESSDLINGSGAQLQQQTSKRTITTTVLIEDGGTVVLGGLIRDKLTNDEQRVPYLGRIPLIGEFFRNRSGTKEKSNLMVFIRPTILRNEESAAIETNARYRNIQDEQRKNKKFELLPLLPGAKQPVLPPMQEPPAKPAAPAKGAATQPTPAPTPPPAPAPEQPAATQPAEVVTTPLPDQQ